MKLAVFSPVFSSFSFEEMLQFLNKHEIRDLEVGCGGYSGKTHIDPAILNKDNKELTKIKSLLKKYDITISALSVHGNCIHPNKEIANSYQKDFEEACILAEKLEVKTIITFSGCPGGSENSDTPNWVTCCWPLEFQAILDYQWNKVLIPYWQKAVTFAKSHGIEKIALELHPGFCCYNPETLLRLRQAVGNMIGVNFDPSHLIWQGMDPVQALLELKECVYHFHAKDVSLNKYNIIKNGVLDTKNFCNEKDRSWIFRTVGYGNDAMMWKNLLSTLNLIEYEGVVSIEHEDSIIEGIEGLEKAIVFLKGIIPVNKKIKKIWWN